MNLHLPQTEEARAEAALLMIVSTKSIHLLYFIVVIFKIKINLLLYCCRTNQILSLQEMVTFSLLLPKTLLQEHIY